MFEQELRCIRCNTKYTLTAKYNCKKCGGILDISYKYDDKTIHIIKNKNVLTVPERILPLKKKEYIYMGQGNTPLIHAKKLSKNYRVKEIALKCEFMNPTGSFKDRPVSVGISMAKHLQKKHVIVASSGNGAASVSAFSAHSGIQAIILIPDSTPLEKIKQTAMYGGKIIKVNGPYSNSFILAKKASEIFDFFNVTSTFINPYMLEGDKLIAYELYYQMLKIIPENIFVPIGAGPLLVGIYKGYKELKELKLIDKTPRMIGVQATGCNPIAAAYTYGKKNVKAIKEPQTVAGGIADGLVGYTQDGEYVLDCIRESGGWCVSCSDSEILKAQQELACMEGLFVEPSSAAAIAAIKKSKIKNKLKATESVLTILTGSGLKDMSIPINNTNIPVVNDFQQLEKYCFTFTKEKKNGYL